MRELYRQLMLRSPLRREEGQGATEYGLVIAVVLLGLVATIGLLATSVTAFLDAVAAAIGAILP